MSNAPGQPRSSGNIDLATLTVAAAASAIAAFVTSKLWPGGTLVSAAMSPVIVAIAKEALTKPVDVTTRRVRDLTTGRTMEVEVEEPARDSDAPFDPLAPVTPPPPTELRREATLHRSRQGRRWKLAVITGVLAFVVAAAVVTVPQVIANAGNGGGGGGTTYFGGGSSSKEKKKDKKDSKQDATPTPTATQTAEPDGTAAPTTTPTPSATATATPSAEATPEATATPSATATAAP